MRHITVHYTIEWEGSVNNIVKFLRTKNNISQFQKVKIIGTCPDSLGERLANDAQIEIDNEYGYFGYR